MGDRRHNSRMSQASIDPRWFKVLAVSVHEFRTPLSVVSGYIRILLSARTGELTDKQRHMLQEIEKSSARLSALVAETSELSMLEEGTAAFEMRNIDLPALVRQAIESLPPMIDGRSVAVAHDLEPLPAFRGDPSRLSKAVASILFALRREMTSDGPLTVRGRRDGNGYEVRIGDGETLAALEAEQDGERAVFDEWRHGVGMSVLIARRVINRHGGRLFAPPEARKTGARIVFGETPQDSAPVSNS
jgi:signal transduction histidine kinase